MFVTEFQVICSLIVVAMGQKRAGIRAKQPDLQPIHGKSDRLLEMGILVANVGRRTTGHRPFRAGSANTARTGIDKQGRGDRFDRQQHLLGHRPDLPLGPATAAQIKEVFNALVHPNKFVTVTVGQKTS